MRLKAEEARDIVNEDHEFWIAETPEEIIGHDRWTVSIRRVFKYKPSDKFYVFIWYRGATEYQYQKPFEYQEECEVIEVKPVEKVVIDWVSV